MAQFDFNLRGALIVPQAKEAIHYYLCLMDVPSGVSSGDFTLSPGDDPSIIQYTYSGDFSKLTGGNTVTINLPIWWYQPYNNVSSVLITDIAGNTVTGDPNKGNPPIIPLNANPNNGFLPTNAVFWSTSIVNPDNTPIYYFVVVMTSTVPNGGYLNYFSLMNPVNTDGEGWLVQAILIGESGYKNVAVIGVIPSGYNQYQWTQVCYSETDAAGSSLAIPWGQGWGL